MIKDLYIDILQEKEKEHKFMIYKLLKNKLQNVTNKNIVFKISKNYVQECDKKSALLDYDYSKKSNITEIMKYSKEAFIEWNFLILREMYQKNFCEECKENLKNIWNKTLATKEQFLKGFQDDKAEFSYVFHDDYTEEGIDYDGGGEYFSGVTYFGKAYNFRVPIGFDDWLDEDDPEGENFGHVNIHFEKQMKSKFVIKGNEFPTDIDSSYMQCKARVDSDEEEDEDEEDEENQNKEQYKCYDYLNQANYAIMEVYKQRKYQKFKY